MKLETFLGIMNSGTEIVAGSETHRMMHELSQEALQLTMELNSSYHSQEEILQIMCKLTGQDIDESFGMFPPFYTDCGKNLHFGKQVFLNAGCKFQDQGGIYIGDGTLIGHNCVIATLNHNFQPELRGNMIPQPVAIGKQVWVGANVTICPGVTVGDGAILAAGAVVTKDVPPCTVVAGVPANVIRVIEQNQK